MNKENFTALKKKLRRMTKLTLEVQDLQEKDPVNKKQEVQLEKLFKTLLNASGDN